MVLVNTFKKLALLLLVSNYVYANEIKQNTFDSQRPDDVNDKKWSSLKAVVQEIKLLPTPDDIGGSRSNFGYSVAIEGNRALVGANLMIGHGVVYVLEFDNTNWNKTDILVPSDEILYGYFGSSVSLSGDRAIVGAFTPSNASIKNQGYAYIYDLVGNTWEETKISADDGVVGDEFGISVSLSGDRALVGAYKNDSSGSAYLYDLVGGAWQETKLTAMDRPNALRFGYSVSLEGDRAIIGAYSGKNSSAVATGSVHVFDLVASNWVETKITPLTGVANDIFGISVSLFGDRMLVGSSGDDDNGSASGSAYIFEYNSGNTTWEQKDKIIASNGMASDNYGTSVTLDNDRALIGAYFNDVGGSNAGAAYIYEFNSSTLQWDETTIVTANDADASDYFGRAVGLSGDVALIASVQNDDLGGNSGSVYFLDFNTGNWDQTKILGNPGPAFSLFGYSVSLDGDRALVGAQWDNDKADSAGAVYIYDLVGNSWVGTKILASDGEKSDTFGESVSLLGDRMLIGASGDDDKGNAAGAAYIFDYNTTTGLWDETIKLKATNGLASDHFGSAVSLSIDRLIIGAYGDDAIANSAGAAYVYDLDGSNNWVESKLLPTVGTDVIEYFGWSVSLEGNRALIGAPYTDDGNGIFTGAAYVFDYNTGITTWEESQKLIPIGGQDYGGFGVQVSLSGSRIMVGAEEEGNDNSGNKEYGAAYIFDYNAGTTSWDETVKLVPTVGSEIEAFGYSLDLEGDRALVGGFEGFFGSGSIGVAYLYDLVGANWVGNEIAPNAGSNNVDFSTAISLSGDKALVSDTSDFERGTRSGAVYVMNLNATEFTVSVNVTGLGASKSVTFENNGESLVVSDNIQTDFAMGLIDNTDYTTLITSHPNNQLCAFTSGNDSGTINGANVVIDVYCNSKPNVVVNGYSVFEDMTLVANDVNGSVMGGNDDSILFNDSDLDGDTLLVENPGTFTMNGLGGEMTIAADGTFSYVPPSDVSGSASYLVRVTDGVFSVLSLISIDVLAVNDAPTFTIIGDILNASTNPNIVNNTLLVDQFAFDISVGPESENSQSLVGFTATIINDSDSVLALNGISVTNFGQLSLDFTGNPGMATIQLTLQDNGGVENNGENTSIVAEFAVSYSIDDEIFSNGFESP